MSLNLSNRLWAQAPVVQKMDSAIHRINHYPVDKYGIRKTNCTIQWIEIYPTDSAIHLSSNWGQDVKLML